MARDLGNCTIEVAKTKALISDQLHGYCEADLRLCFHICRLLVFPCGGSSILQDNLAVPQYAYKYILKAAKICYS